MEVAKLRGRLYYCKYMAIIAEKAVVAIDELEVAGWAYSKRLTQINDWHRNVCHLLSKCRGVLYLHCLP